MYDLLLQYYGLIESVLRDKPHLKPCLKNCKHCQIPFFTNFRNVNRSDLFCPFGCRESHRRQESTRRSIAYYRKYKEKKRTQNRRRYLIQDSEPENSSQQEECAGYEECEEVTPIHEYVRILISLIEGRRVSMQEIIKMLTQKARQHSMARERRVDYIIRQLSDHWP